MKLIEYLDSRGIQYEADGDAVRVEGYLNLIHSAVTELPGNLSVSGSLDLSRTAITKLPGNLSVGGFLDLSYTAVTKLPHNLSVGLWLDLSHSDVTKLPDNLSLGGRLELRGSPVTELPDNFSCRSLYLDPERISNVAYRENCGEEERTIFATWTNGEFRIAAGCFFDTIDVFESAVDKKYSGRAAEAYKQAARDCVAELREKLGITGGISEH